MKFNLFINYLSRINNFWFKLFNAFKKEAEGPPNFCLAEKLVEMKKLML